MPFPNCFIDMLGEPSVFSKISLFGSSSPQLHVTSGSVCRSPWSARGSTRKFWRGGPSSHVVFRFNAEFESLWAPDLLSIMIFLLFGWTFSACSSMLSWIVFTQFPLYIQCTPASICQVLVAFWNGRSLGLQMRMTSSAPGVMLFHLDSQLSIHRLPQCCQTFGWVDCCAGITGYRVGASTHCNGNGNRVSRLLNALRRERMGERMAWRRARWVWWKENLGRKGKKAACLPKVRRANHLASKAMARP